MSIAWRDAMSVGDAAIDADHRHLIELINSFEAAVTAEIDHKRVARVLLALMDYTAEHFAREEALQKEVRYPYADCHRRAHRDLLTRLTGIVQAYGAQAPGPARDHILRGLSDFLKEWLVSHVIESDLGMKPHVITLRRHQAENERRTREAIALSERMAGIER
ncbi:conserved hypothetical protein [Magnetospirillum sp. LM-5]|uniref:bacteriohemerythrin n=1 Tax=Magnetospirillum sp. LM-5 TaxID=2681466 RepID=UPI00138510D2|nr:hemerythrin family protein [Magnetospirillum sp. LM-5]CAA7623001.1 conserved hypothetical protein [Magnetospirillum sp. LM-5]